jgi:hypothetical protein
MLDLITPIEELDDIQISEAEMPDVVSKQFQNIIDTDRRVKEAEESCELAKEAAAKQSLAKGIRQNEAINSTQDAVKSLAEAQTALSDSQKMLFENQQIMANGIRYLLVLGASSIAMNRIVIRELEAKLKKASKEELSDRAREELIGVVKMLREQENAFSKQDRMSEQIAETKKTVRIHGKEIESIHETDSKQDATDERHDALIAENASKNIEQDTEIKRQRAVDVAHDALLKKIKGIAVAGLVIAIVALVLSIIGLLF